LLPGAAHPASKILPGGKVTAIYNSATEALEQIKKGAPDLLFLDVEMPRLNGFQLLEALRTSASI
jgi:two-component system LytT family response regulator